MTTKRCSKCVRAKSLLDFYETKKGSGKFMSACKESPQPMMAVDDP